MSLDLLLCATLAIVTVTDLDRRAIPNRVLAVAAAGAIGLAAVDDPSSLTERSIAALAGGGALLPLALAHPRGLGMGDVKLVAVMGLFLGSALAVAASAAFAAGALAGAIIVLREGLAARKRALPLAPFLALGGVLGLIAGHSIVAWWVARVIGA
jgi:prepilin signal peptidase PulO-like enzyme (type II secretory pathway)